MNVIASQVVGNLLHMYLGNFVEGLGTNMAVNLSSGELVLRDLRLKPDSLYLTLNLPITVKCGFIGKFQLELPWSCLKTKPTKLIVDRVCIIAGPKYDYDPAAEEQRLQKAKQSKLAFAELLRASKQEESCVKDNPAASFSQRVGGEIMDNLQISVNNLHIRYEDDTTNPTRPFVAGIVVENVLAQSTDSSWNPCTVSGSNIVHKLVEVKNLSAYWQCGASFLTPGSLESYMAQLDAFGQNESEASSYIVKNISWKAKMTINRNKIPDPLFPETAFELDLDEIDFDLNDTQYKDFMELLDIWSDYGLGEKYRKLKPSGRPKDNLLKWFQYAAKAQLSDIQEAKKVNQWSYIKQFIQYRKEYLLLYRKLLAEVKMTPSELARLTELETLLTYEQISFMREIAHQAYKYDKEFLERKCAELKQQRNQQGWFSRVLSFTRSDPTAAEFDAVMDLTPEMEKEVFCSVIEIPLSNDFHDVVQSRSKYYLHRGKVTLRKNRQPLAIIDFNDLSIQLSFFHSSNTAVFQAELRTITVHDHSTPDTKFPVLLFPISTTPTLGGESNMLTSPTPGGEGNMLTFKFEYKPFQRDIDYLVDLSMENVGLIYNAPLIDTLIDYLSPSGAAWKRIGQLTNQAKLLLKHGLEKEKKLGVTISITNPRIIFPNNFSSEDCTVGVVELENLSLTKEAFHQKDEEDPNSEFYHHFIIFLCQARVLLARYNENWADPKEEDLPKILFCDRFDVGFMLQLRNIISEELPKYRIQGELQEAFVFPNFTPTKFNQITDVASIFTSPRKPPEQVENTPVEQQLGTKMTFFFTVDKLIAHVKASEGEDNLCTFAFSSFRFLLEKEPTYYTINASVRSFLVEDNFCEKVSGTKKYLAISHCPEGLSEISTNDLIKITYKSSQLVSDSHKTKEEIAIDMNQLNFYCNYRTVASLLQILDRTFVKADGPQVTPEPTTSTVPASEESTLHTKVSLQLLQVFLVTDIANIAAIVFRNLAFTIDRTLTDYSVVGCLHSVAIQDMTPQGRTWPEIVSLQPRCRQSLVNLAYKSLGKTAQLECNISGLQFVYLARFLDEIQKYSSAFRKSMGVTANRAEEMARNAVSNFSSSTQKLLRYTVIVDNPNVIVPESSSSTSVVSLDLGQIAISSEFEDRIPLTFETICIKIAKLNGTSLVWEGSENLYGINRRRMLYDVDLALTATMPLIPAVITAETAPVLATVPLYKVACKLTPFGLIVNEGQYNVIFNIYEHNILEQAATITTSSLEEGKPGEQSTPEKVSSFRNFKSLHTDIHVVADELSIGFCKGHELSSIDPLQSKPVVRLAICDIDTTYQTLESSDLLIDFSCSSLKMEDTRIEVENKHRVLLGPPNKALLTNSEGTETQVRLKYQRSPDQKQIIDAAINHARGVIELKKVTEIQNYLKLFWDNLQAMLSRRAVHTQPPKQPPKPSASKLTKENLQAQTRKHHKHRVKDPNTLKQLPSENPTVSVPTSTPGKLTTLGQEVLHISPENRSPITHPTTPPSPITHPTTPPVMSSEVPPLTPSTTPTLNVSSLFAPITSNPPLTSSVSTESLSLFSSSSSDSSMTPSNTQLPETPPEVTPESLSTTAASEALPSSATEPPLTSTLSAPLDTSSPVQSQTSIDIVVKVNIVSPTIHLLEDMNNPDSECVVITASIQLESAVSIVDPFDAHFEYMSSKSNVSSELHLNPLRIVFSYQDFKLFASIVPWTSKAPPTPSEPAVPASGSPTTISEAVSTPQHVLQHNKHATSYLLPSDSTMSEPVASSTNEPPSSTTDSDGLSASSSPSTMASSETGLEPTDLQLDTEEHFSQTLCVSCAGATVTLIDDCTNDIAPLLKLSLTTFTLDMTASTTWNIVMLSFLRAKYFNNNNGRWEPLLEPWAYQLRMKRSHSDALKISLLSEIRVDLSITRAFIDTCINTYNIWIKDFYKESSGHDPLTSLQIVSSTPTSSSTTSASIEGDELSATFTQHSIASRSLIRPYHIRNETGVMMWFWLPHERDTKPLPPGEEEVLLISQDLIRTQASLLSVVLPGNNFCSASVWESDMATTSCRRCHKDFSLFFRRIFCAQCCPPKSKIGTGPLRVCLDCSEMQKRLDLPITKFDEPTELSWLCQKCGHINLPMVKFCVCCSESKPATASPRGLSKKKSNKDKRQISFQIVGAFKPIVGFPLRIGTYTLPLTEDTPRIKVICEVGYRKGSKVLTVRSNLVIENCSTIHVEVLVQRGSESDFTDPDLAPTKSIPVPIHLSRDCVIQIRPHAGFEWSTPLEWKQLKLLTKETFRASTQLICSTKDTSYRKEISFQCCISREGGVDLQGRHYSCHEFRVSLHAPLFFENLLPVQLCWSLLDTNTNTVCLEGKQPPEHSTPIHDVPDKPSLSFFVTIEHFAPTKPMELDFNLKNENISMLPALDHQREPLFLVIHQLRTQSGSLMIRITCPFWLVNKTGLPMLFRTRSPVGFSEDHRLAPGHYVAESDGRIGFKPCVDETPFMFSLEKWDPLAHKLEIKVGSSAWSKGIALNKQNSVETLDLQDSKPRPGKQPIPLFCVGISIKPAPNKFWRTRVVTFSPRYVISNESQRDLLIRQKDSQCVVPLPRGSVNNFNWHDSSLAKYLILTIPEEGQMWSGSIPVDKLGSFAVKVRSAVAVYLIPVNIKVVLATTYICFTPEADFVPPYRIENRSAFTLIVHQDKLETFEILPSMTAIPYTWDELTLPHKLVVHVMPSNKSFQLNIDVFGTYQPPSADGIPIKVETYADGPTRVIRATNIGEGTLAITEERGQLRYAISLNLEGIGLSLVDHIPQELAYISLDSLKIDWALSSNDMKMQVTLESLQIDNQLYRTPFPVLLRPTDGTAKPFLHFTLIKLYPPKDPTEGQTSKAPQVEMYRYICLLVQEMDLNLEESWIKHLLSAVNVNLDILKLRDQDPKAQYVPSVMLYLHTLHLNPIKVNFSFFSNSSVQQKDDTIDDSIAPFLALPTSALQVENASLKFNCLLLRNPFATQDELVNRILMHYRQQALSQLYKLLGSFDVIGSPISLLDNLGTGFFDFFHEPAKGIIKSPKDFGRGLAKGTLSMLDHSVFALANSTAKIADSIGKGLGALALDPDWKMERSIQSQEKPKHLVHGFGLGVFGIGKGFVTGVAGIVQHPVRGAIEGGAKGFLKGVGKGLVGVPVKPTVGLVDFVGKTAEGLKNTTSTSVHCIGSRRRLPRCIPPDRTLETYSAEKAEGRAILENIESGKYVRRGAAGSSEVYIFHVPLAGKQVFLCTTEHIFILVQNKFVFNKHWSVQLLKVTAAPDVNYEQLKLTLYYRLPVQLTKNAMTRDVQFPSTQSLEKGFTLLSDLVQKTLMNPPPPKHRRKTSVPTLVPTAAIATPPPTAMASPTISVLTNIAGQI
ncbi:vacuolar protein sorting-associated protein vps13 [Pelomyxa schiedti]|nr:vacuolar protein sorting-associated protein vps13 [Pelomyxa schiedti]